MMKGWTDAAVNKQKSAAGNTSTPTPTTEPPQPPAPRQRVKTAQEQSAPAKLKPRYYVATFEGFAGGKLTIIDLPPALLLAVKKALEGLGIQQAT